MEFIQEATLLPTPLSNFAFMIPKLCLSAFNHTPSPPTKALISPSFTSNSFWNANEEEIRRLRWTEVCRH
ncbi:hypothetical protein L2E82_37403 [Cichorium intybus]|uniref:Uncharacterized protein n=1 Tax=Cichorium intybus TaxID=13427 RepID=A0ACB9AEG4_CICIN|nr:hypothetical protein L2E82_37403 [Cichorium intybus]